MKKTLVKILSIAFAVCASCLILTGCSSTPSPTEVVKAELDAVKNKDSATMDKLYKSLEASMGDTKLTDSQNEVMKKLVDKVCDYDYTIGEEKIDGDTATVEVTFKTYNFGKMFDATTQNVMSEATTLALQGKNMSQEKIMNLLFKEMDKQLDKLSKKSKEGKATLELTKKDGKWQLDDLGSEAQNALLGGLMESEALK